MTQKCRRFEKVRGTKEAISRRKFELLVGDVFHRKNFTVMEKDSSEMDVGIELVLQLGVHGYQIQCTMWRTLDFGISREGNVIG